MACPKGGDLDGPAHPEARGWVRCPRSSRDPLPVRVRHVMLGRMSDPRDSPAGSRLIAQAGPKGAGPGAIAPSRHPTPSSRDMTKGVGFVGRPLRGEAAAFWAQGPNISDSPPCASHTLLASPFEARGVGRGRPRVRRPRSSEEAYRRGGESFPSSGRRAFLHAALEPAGKSATSPMQRVRTAISSPRGTVPDSPQYPRNIEVEAGKGPPRAPLRRVSRAFPPLPGELQARQSGGW